MDSKEGERQPKRKRPAASKAASDQVVEKTGETGVAAKRRRRRKAASGSAGQIGGKTNAASKPRRPKQAGKTGANGGAGAGRRSVANGAAESGKGADKPIKSGSAARPKRTRRSKSQDAPSGSGKVTATERLAADERAERSGSADKPARPEKADRSKQSAKANRPTKGDRPTKAGKASNVGKPTKKKSTAEKPRKESMPASSKKARKKKRERKPLSAMEVVAKVLPVLSLAASLVLVGGLYKYLFEDKTSDAQQETTAVENTVASTEAAKEQPDQSSGVEDPWTSTKTFTTGEQELDEKVKAFCDALTLDGNGALENAQNVYNTIVWGSYIDRGEEEKPAGEKWVLACAKEYFNTAVPEEGIAGEGDYYDFAAALCYCLRYFGYSDAIAIPVLVAAESGTTTGSAYCLVSDENGYPRLCDPSQGANGWMLDRYSYNILVDDIGQDLTTAEALGLSIQRAEDANANTNSTSANGDSTESDSQTSSTDAVGSGTESSADGTSTESATDGSSTENAADGAQTDGTQTDGSAYGTQEDQTASQNTWTDEYGNTYNEYGYTESGY